jgi:hypothetical protein
VLETERRVATEFFAMTDEFTVRLVEETSHAAE